MALLDDQIGLLRTAVELLERNIAKGREYPSIEIRCA